MFVIKFFTLSFHIQDKSSQDIECFFNEIFEFMEDVSKKGKLLVHCQMGKSRSVSIVIAYLMKFMRMKLNDAYTYVKRIRKMALPNIGFMKALGNYEKELFI